MSNEEIQRQASALEAALQQFPTRTRFDSVFPASTEPPAHTAPPAFGAPAAPPVAPASPGVNPAVLELANALAEHAASGQASVDPVAAMTAQQLLDELRALRVGAPDQLEERRRQAWQRVVAARSAYKRVLDGGATMPVASVNAADLSRIEQESRDLDEAERKARKSLSGPSAFKKFAAARRQLEASLAAFGVATIDELRQLATSAVPSGPRTLSEASDAVAVAEQEWTLLEHQGADALLDSPAADAVRARAYRLLGRVVGDDMLEAELRRIADGSKSNEHATARIAAALGALGVPAGDDPVTAGRAVVAVMMPR
jgi:hypothetical protein